MNSFHDIISDAQIEMVMAAQEYCNGQASDVFVYFSSRDGMMEADVFFVINNEVIEKHQVPGVDTSVEQQENLLSFFLDQESRILAAGNEFEMHVPLEGLVHYDAISKSLSAKYNNQEQTQMGKYDDFATPIDYWISVTRNNLGQNA
jgi:hypothetical protein